MKRLPNIGEYVRGAGTLVTVETPTPTPPPKEYIFETISARIETRRNGKVLREGGTYWDAYGLETSISEAIKDARAYAEADGITATSEIELAVVRIVEYHRAKPTNQENFYDANFPAFAMLDFGSKRDVPEDRETDVWSTRAPSSPDAQKEGE